MHRLSNCDLRKDERNKNITTNMKIETIKRFHFHNPRHVWQLQNKIHAYTVCMQTV